MLTLTRRQIQSVGRVVRAVFRRPAPSLPIEFRCNNGRLILRSCRDDVAVATCLIDVPPFAPFAVSLEAFKTCAGRSDDPVTFCPEGDQITLHWTDRGIPQQQTFAGEPLPETFPGVPETWSGNPPELLGAMQAAGETTDAEATRYGLNCVQLRGEKGRIAATDSRQLLVQTGYAFPWNEDVLVPQSAFFGCAEIPRDQPVTIGRTEEHVLFRTGAWTLWLPIEKAARYPNIDAVVPAPGTEVTTVALAEADARFLGPALARLPVDRNDFHRCVTVDLNGHVAIRSRLGPDSRPTELILGRSRWTGLPLRFGTDRKFLARAMQLGFRELSLISPEAPVCCRDGRRRYVWMLLEGQDCLPASDDCVRIDSAAAEPDPQSSHHSLPPERQTMPRLRNRLPDNIRTTASEAAADGPLPDESSAAGDAPVLVQAERLRTALTNALHATRRLIRTLKQQRKQDRLVRTTLASLKELRTLDA